MEYLLKTNVEMKPYNCKRYWIMNDIIRSPRITADSVDSALEKFSEVAKRNGVVISNTSLARKEPMYNNRDEQVGFVFTGSVDIDNFGKLTKQYVDVWVEVIELHNPFIN